MSRTPFGIALAAVALVSPLGAQTWQSIGVPTNNNSGAYWNNASDDRTSVLPCNVGAILTNSPNLQPTSCNNQGPVYIPLNPAPLTTLNVFLGAAGGSNPGAFRFAAGSYDFGLIGRVAGNRTTAWGTIDDAGNVLTAAQLTSGSASFTTPFAVWITQSLPVVGRGTVYSSAQTVGLGAILGRASTINQQFAVFMNGTGLAGSGSLGTDAFGTIINAYDSGTTFYVGMEDNVNGGRGFGPSVNGDVSDRDYQDILISIKSTVVPEPATVGLMGFGLLALLGVSKRRQV